MFIIVKWKLSELACYENMLKDVGSKHTEWGESGIKSIIKLGHTQYFKLSKKSIVMNFQLENKMIIMGAGCQWKKILS